MDVLKVNIDLSLDQVESGGNTAGGKYFYSFTPGLLVVQNGPAQLEYRFGPDVASHYKIVGAFSTDSKFQLGPPEIAPDGRSLSVSHLNTQPQLTFLTLLVRNTSTNELISCDPQITNTPGEVP